MPTVSPVRFSKRLCVIRLHVMRQHKHDTPLEQMTWEEEALTPLREASKEFEIEVDSLISKLMPRTAVLESIKFTQTGVEIVVGLGIISSICTAFAGYQDYAEGIELFTAQLRGFIRRFLPADVCIDASAIYGSHLSLLPLPATARVEKTSVPVIYLVLTNAVLIGVLIYILLSR